MGLRVSSRRIIQSLYRPNDRGWVKINNPNYWRRDAEREGMAREARALGRQPISLILG
jgi:hypothetical protein